MGRNMPGRVIPYAEKNGYGYYGGAYETLLLQWHDPVTKNYMGDGDWVWSFTSSDGQTCSNATKVRF